MTQFESDLQSDKAWFAPKAYGFGAGRPIVWQGWAMLAAHVALIALGAVLLRHALAARLAWIVCFALVPMPLYAAKTRGGWKWRWGGR